MCGFEFPWCLGTVWPLGAGMGVQIHMLHLAFGVLVGLGVFWLTWAVFRGGGAAWTWRGEFTARPKRRFECR